MPLPHLATRIFDTPLLIAPQKFEVILGVLAPRLGLDVPAPVAAVTAQPAARKAYEVTSDGIAVIPIEGTLVHKAQGWTPRPACGPMSISRTRWRMRPRTRP